jgi:hypothetical protein
VALRGRLIDLVILNESSALFSEAGDGFASLITVNVLCFQATKTPFNSPGYDNPFHGALYLDEERHTPCQNHGWKGITKENNTNEMRRDGRRKAKC